MYEGISPKLLFVEVDKPFWAQDLNARASSPIHIWAVSKGVKALVVTLLMDNVYFDPHSGFGLGVVLR